MRLRFGPVLGRKLVRELNTRKASIVVIVLIVTIGTGALITFMSVWRDLEGARVKYYRDYRLADFSIDMKRAPESAVLLAAQVPNVRLAQGRVQIGALVTVPSQPEPITGMVISLPMEPRPVLNDVFLRSGTWFSGTDDREAILNESFAKANGLRPGDRIEVQLLDELHEVLIVGLAVSPEFVYLIPMDGGLAPDPARFGVMYMGEEFLQRSADQDGAYNQIIGKVFDASPVALANTLDLLEDALEPWGVANSTPVEDQPSVRFLRDELAGIKASSRAVPALFLIVALLILNVLMNRMVAQQRTIIGTLKALGRSSTSIALHYLGFGMVIGLIGGLGGSAFTMWLQPIYVELFAQFYTLPDLRAHVYPDLHLLGIGVSVTAACVGTLRAVGRAVRLEPAEAMRPPPPEKGGKVFVEKIGLLWEGLSFRWRLVTRAIFRNPFRSSVSVLTAFVAAALMVTTFSLFDALEYLMDYQFNAMSREDLTVSLREPAGLRGPLELASISGISSVEPQLGIVCDLSNGAHQKRAVVTGLPSNNRLFTPLDSNGNKILIPRQGLVMSDKLASLLGVGVGDTVSLRPLIGRRERVEAPIVSVVKTYLGISAYADIEYLSRLIGEDWVANALLGTTYRADNWEGMYREIKRRPTVVGVSRRTRALEQLQATFGETQGAMLGVMILFAGLIAFGSVLNTALVTLNEREREVGTLRVLGYSPWAVTTILGGELLILSVVGTVLGVFGGIGLTHLMAQAYDTELYRFPVVIQSARLVQAAILMGIFVGLAEIVVLRHVSRVDWLQALKIKE